MLEMPGLIIDVMVHAIVACLGICTYAFLLAMVLVRVIEFWIQEGEVMDSKSPNPGSREALSKGCRCPVMDNGHGAGWMGRGSEGIFVISADCPIHSSAASNEEKERTTND